MHDNYIEKLFKRYQQSQEITTHQNRASDEHELICSISTAWEFMREICVNPIFRNKWYTSQDLFNGLKDNSVIQQKSLLRLILTVVQDENINEIRSSGKGQVWYLFANAVASYSSYNNFYWISQGASKVLVDYDIDSSKPVTRNRIFQIRRERKKLLVFEHMCPATQLIYLILEKKRFIQEEYSQYSQCSINELIDKMIKKLLREYGLVAIVTKEEDNKLSGSLRNKLDLSKHGSLPQMMNRYDSAGIGLENKLIPVYGKMYR